MIVRAWALALLLVALATVPIAHAADRALILQNLSTANGLPQGTVMATLQDSQGFVWLGTEDGLVRFDGHEVHRYAYSALDPQSLAGNFVNAIAQDSSGDLWIGIKGAGVARWERRTDRFIAYRHDPADAHSLSSDAVRTVLVDAQGYIWVGTLDAGLNRLDPRSGRATRFRHEETRADSLSDDQVQTLLQDSSGQIFAGTHAGLDRWLPGTVSFVHYPVLGSTQSAHISQVIEDAAGTLWVGTFDAGLHRMDRAGKPIASYRHEAADPGSLISNDVRALLDEPSGNFWVGTAEGLDLLDPATGRFTHYRHDKADPDSLGDSFVMSLYRDEAGLVWIGLRAGGVSRWNPRSWELGGHRPDWLDGKLVTAFADAGEGRVWIASLGGGLMRFNPATGEAVSLRSLLAPGTRPPDPRVMSLLTDRRGALWIGTMTQGLFRLDGDRLHAIPVSGGDPHATSDAGIMALYEARDGLIWIGTHGGGANVLDPATGFVRQLPHSSGDPTALSSAIVTSFAEDAQGRLWIGTDGGGLDLAERDGRIVRVFRHRAGDSSSLAANTIYSLASDAQGNIWIATDGGGLDLVSGSSQHPDRVRFEHRGISNGLSSETIYGVVPDADGQLWLSGNAGLVRLDPRTSHVETYHREHGLQGEEFNFGAFGRLGDGRLCFGGPAGFNIFDPRALSRGRRPPQLALIHLEVLGAPLRSSQPYWLLKDIELDDRDNIVSFDFATLDFTSPARNRLAYRMPGLTERWIDLGSQRRVTLTNLDAGDHVLEVRAVNADSVLSERPLRLMIHKRPAPWQSLPAYIGYAVAVVLVVLLALRAQRQRLRNALAIRQHLELQVAARTQELRESNRRLVEASEAKTSFLARMSHELRTPMNGVLGMAELLARTPLNTQQARQTQTIRSSAQTLLNILNDLLDLSKAQAGKVSLESLPVDLTQLIEESAALFAGAAEAKALDLIVCPPTQRELRVAGDPLRLRQVLMNLIGNAVKFTEHGGIEIRADVALKSAGLATVQIAVRDTGIGLAPDSLERIFQPFAQADETTTRRFGGSGLGLTICRELVTLMNGSIRVESLSNVGSTFTVSLEMPVAPAAAKAAPSLELEGSVRILSRNHALGESVTRYVGHLGLSACGPVVPEAASRDADFLIVDADSCAEELSQLLVAVSPERLVVLASGRLLDAGMLGPVAPGVPIVRKPVNRSSLLDGLNARAAKAFASDPSLRSATDATTARGCALIVEDDEINASVAQGYLRQLGFHSVWVFDGAEAVRRSASERFEVILMDLNMPGVDGYTAAALIRQAERNGRRVPIIALTANTAAAYRDSCLGVGMDDILSKPYTLEQFAAVIERWTSGKIGGGAVHSQPAERSLATLDPAALKALARLKGADGRPLLPRLTGLFADSCEASLRELRAALLRSDLDGGRRIAHRLKAAAANVAALGFSETLGALEVACRSQEATRAIELLEALETACPSLLTDLGRQALQVSA